MTVKTRARGARRRANAALSVLANGSPPPAPPPSPAQIAAARDRTDFDSMRRLLAFTLRPDDNCIDIGAHRGDVLAEMARVAPQGRHIAFEPIPQLAAELRELFPGVEVHQAACSDHPGESEFAHVRGSAEGWSGLRFRPLPTGEPADVENITVPLLVLDQTLPADYRPAAIKVDVEGAEEQVFRGALETLRRHRPVLIFEHGLGSADVYGTTPGAIYALLRDEVGYRVFDLDGNGPYPLEEFERVFSHGERVNFVAHP